MHQFDDEKETLHYSFCPHDDELWCSTLVDALTPSKDVCKPAKKVVFVKAPKTGSR